MTVKTIPKLDKNILQRIPARLAHHYRFLPSHWETKSNTLNIFIDDPHDLERLDAIARELHQRIRCIKVSSETIFQGLKENYGIGAETIEFLQQIKFDQINTSTGRLGSPPAISTITDDPSMAKFVNQIIREAFTNRATDIHIEPFEERLKIRYRIDGLLHDISVPGLLHQFQDSIITRIKILADMNIAEKRLPQDGRFGMTIENEELDLRVSVIPIAHGECANIRLLRKTSGFIDLHGLGYQNNALRIVKKAIRKPHGIILVTGPTGSGKTTTLYACLNELNTPERKIFTIEDPIEFEMPGLCQMQILPKIGFSFPIALRSILRHDPDMILVGEIRDMETAELAIRAALTGHLVFSTLHTNDAPSAVVRLIDLGLEPFLVASSLQCVIAQRLVRTLCPDCRITKEPKSSVLAELKIDADSIKNHQFFAGNGCEHCHNSGYFGRTAIHEIMLLDDSLRDLIMQRVSSGRLRSYARAQGMTSLRSEGWKRVLAGETTPEEILRVTETDED